MTSTRHQINTVNTMCFQETALIRKIKTFKETNEQDKATINSFFFPEDLIQEIFSNLHVGQYNLLSHFTTKEKKHVQKGELLLLSLSCIFK